MAFLDGVSLLFTARVELSQPPNLAVGAHAQSGKLGASGPG
jgi:hypothetical protein